MSFSVFRNKYLPLLHDGYYITSKFNYPRGEKNRLFI